MGSNFSSELLELIDNRLEYQVMSERERERERYDKLLLVVVLVGS